MHSKTCLCCETVDLNSFQNPPIKRLKTWLDIKKKNVEREGKTWTTFKKIHAVGKLQEHRYQYTSTHIIKSISSNNKEHISWFSGSRELRRLLELCMCV